LSRALFMLPSTGFALVERAKSHLSTGEIPFTMEPESSYLKNAPEHPFDRLVWIMNRLLAPDGCPWDREQTHESLKQYLIEESYEVLDCVDSGDFAHLREELGDVALQVVFHAALAEREGRFDIRGVLDTVSEKLVRRHPHVFGETQVSGSDQVLANWETIKKQEKADRANADAPCPSLVDGVPKHLPALQKAHRLQSRVARVGFDWPSTEGTIEKVREEFDELVVERDSGNPERVYEEMGYLLFAIVNVARKMNVQPEEALQSACRKFAERFRHIETRAEEMQQSLDAMTLEEMDALWDEAKAKERKAIPGR
jgi:tetrapyrrole methylase family protein/MazG family protein